MNSPEQTARSLCTLELVYSALQKAGEEGAAHGKLAEMFGVGKCAISKRVRRLRELKLVETIKESEEIDGRRVLRTIYYAKDPKTRKDLLPLAYDVAMIWEERPFETIASISEQFGKTYEEVRDAIDYGRTIGLIPSLGDLQVNRFEDRIIKQAKRLLASLPEYIKDERARICADGYEPPLLYELEQYRRYLECRALRRIGKRWSHNGAIDGAY